MKDIPTIRIAGKSACILIVDDELQNRQLLEVMLQAAGHRTLSAVSGEEALAMIGRELPDLILLDIIMPGLDGFQIAAQLKKNPATENIPIIMITALQERSATILGLKAGAEEFITRPIDHIELCLRVKNLLRLKEGTAELNRVNGELHKLVDEKDILLKELHHRVKNNLQIMSSILSLQSNYIQEPKLLEVFHESQARIRSIALIHELLYQKGHLDRIDFKEYVENLVENIFRTIGADTDRISYSLACDSALMDPDSVIHCGLIVNELITNSFKYAFPGDRHGIISVGLRVRDGTCVLTVADDGIGLPPDHQIKTSRSMGLQLVDVLIRQIGATLEIGRIGGASYTLTFLYSQVNGENG
jgi:two-component sensor histidine kinase